MRKCFERVKMDQALRLMKEGLNNRDDIVKISLEDIKNLNKDKDIKDLLNDQDVTLKRCIGFVR